MLVLWALGFMFFLIGGGGKGLLAAMDAEPLEVSTGLVFLMEVLTVVPEVIELLFAVE